MTTNNHRRIDELEPAVVGLPPFPAKHSLRRQTPDFLHQRGTALACYLQAALAEPRVVALDEVQALLADAPTAGDPAYPPSTPIASPTAPPSDAIEPRQTPLRASSSAGTPSLPPSPALLAAAAPAQPSGDQGAAAATCGGSRASLAPWLACLGPLLVALALGHAYDRVVLAAACFALGLLASALSAEGAKTPAPSGSEMPARERTASAASYAPLATPPATPTLSGVGSPSVSLSISRPISASGDPISRPISVSGDPISRPISVSGSVASSVADVEAQARLGELLVHLGALFARLSANCSFVSRRITL